MGYFRPVSHFNIGKKSEHYNRIHYTEKAVANSLFIRKYSVHDVDCMNSATHTTGLSR
jgi:hypothetical protein